jgi:hypothetical protein
VHASDELLLSVHVIRGGIPKTRRKTERERLFSEGQARTRSPNFEKRCGWGVHSGGEGRIALYAADSPRICRISRRPHSRAQEGDALVHKACAGLTSAGAGDILDFIQANRRRGMFLMNLDDDP